MFLQWKQNEGTKKFAVLLADVTCGPWDVTQSKYSKSVLSQCLQSPFQKKISCKKPKSFHVPKWMEFCLVTSLPSCLLQLSET